MTERERLVAVLADAVESAAARRARCRVALRALLFDPLGPSGDGAVRLRWFDHVADEPVEAESVQAPDEDLARPRTVSRRHGA